MKPLPAKVLVFDDDQDDLYFIKAILVKYIPGHWVEANHSVSQGIDHIARHYEFLGGERTVFLVDVNLGTKDSGISLLDEIHEVLPQAHLALMSGDRSMQQVAEATEYIEIFLYKDLDYAEFEQNLRSYLESIQII